MLLLSLVLLALWWASTPVSLASSPIHVLPGFTCNRIAFYRLYKVGSTTLQVVLKRVAERQGLKQFVEPPETGWFVHLDFENPALAGGTGPDGEPYGLAAVHVLLREGQPASEMRGLRRFFAMLLGSAQYGFVTLMRHPVDRYVSMFYYYDEYVARAAGTPVTLADILLRPHIPHANEIAKSFGLETVDDVVAFTASEAFAGGASLYLTTELMHYGMALMAVKCGWWPFDLIIKKLNTAKQHTQPGEHAHFASANVSWVPRPSLRELRTQRPDVYRAIMNVNNLDILLYNAARTALLKQLDIAPAAVFSTAVLVRTSSRRLEALQGGVSPGCWPWQYDNVTLADLPASATTATRECVHFSNEVQRWQAEDFWHTALVLHLVSRGGQAVETPGREQLDAVAAWAVHHALERVQRLVLRVARQEQVAPLRAAVRHALAACGGECAFTSVEVVAGAGEEQRLGLLARVRASARWSAELWSPLELMAGVEGPLRSVLLAVEADPEADDGARPPLAVRVREWTVADPEPSATSGTARRWDATSVLRRLPCVPKPCAPVASGPAAAARASGNSMHPGHRALIEQQQLQDGGGRAAASGVVGGQQQQASSGPELVPVWELAGAWAPGREGAGVAGHRRRHSSLHGGRAALSAAQRPLGEQAEGAGSSQHERLEALAGIEVVRLRWQQQAKGGPPGGGAAGSRCTSTAALPRIRVPWCGE